MTILEVGAIASGMLAVITLTGKIIKLITTIQTLITSIDRLQIDTMKNAEHWEVTKKQYEILDQRLGLIEYELAII